MGGGQVTPFFYGGYGFLLRILGHLLNLVHREVAVDNGMENLQMEIDILHIDQCTGMSHADLLIAQGQLSLGR